MAPVPGGRFCYSCAKKVIDFSLMSDRQIIEILSNSTQALCGRFLDEQLNRDLSVRNYQLNAFLPRVLLCTSLAAGLITPVFAAKKSLPVEQTDTTFVPLKTGDDNGATSASCNSMPGYAALKEDFVVKGYAFERKSYTVGGMSGTITATSVVKHRRLSWFRRLLITLGLSKRPA